mgnify:CR=1 FL=1
MRRFSMAVIQLSSTQDPEENLQEIGAFVREAAERGAQAAALPECALYRGLEMERYAQDVPGGAAVRRLAQLARETGLWLHCGSLYERAPQGGRPYNCTLVIRPDGTLAGKYRKLHPFDVAVPNGPAVRESDQIRPGEEIVTVDAGDLGTWGLSICYDLRFGELYRLMALEGAQVLFVPANFTLNTGRDHWEVLIRARAIENGCYVVAPGQFGPGPEFPAFGRSMVADPWGNVIARAPDRPGVILADIDLDYVDEIRRRVGTLDNRRRDKYRLERR